MWILLFHWVTVALVVLAVTAVLAREFVGDRGIRLSLLLVHRGAGLMVLAISLVRILFVPGRLIRDSGSRWMRRVALTSHFALYGVLIANPVLGWVLSSAYGQTVYFLGVVPLPPLIARNRDLADQLHDVHIDVAIVLLILVSLHSAAALWHHYAARDSVLRRMLPWRGHGDERGQSS